MPLLTLKMDLYHTGKEEPDDDHKFVNERLLEVAVLEKPRPGQEHVTLEDCLEHYFNNRVEVKRHLERQRRMTQESVDRVLDQEKAEALRIETVEVVPMAETPTVETPRAGTPSLEVMTAEIPKKGPIERLRPSVARSRADSIFSQRRVKVGEGTAIPAEQTVPTTGDEKRKGSLSTRTEVLMPAWQFFKLLRTSRSDRAVQSILITNHSQHGIRTTCPPVMPK